MIRYRNINTDKGSVKYSKDLAHRQNGQMTEFNVSYQNCKPPLQTKIKALRTAVFNIVHA
jgi:hypothetical protein